MRYNTGVEAFEGDKRLRSLVIRDKPTDTTEEITPAGVFVFIGLKPNSRLPARRGGARRQGFVKTGMDLQTTMPGIFAAGDVRAGSTKQAASAVGEGATAALMIREYLKHV